MKKTRIFLLAGTLMVSAGLISAFAFQGGGSNVDCTEKTYDPIIILDMVIPNCTGAASNCIDCVVTPN